MKTVAAFAIAALVFIHAPHVTHRHPELRPVPRYLYGAHR